MKLLHKLSQAQTLVSLPPATSVKTAADLMTQKSVGSVLVMDADQLVGIFTERDLLNRVVSPSLKPESIPLSQVMTRKVLTVDLNDTLEVCYAKMQQAHARHVPILHGTKVVGMVTMRDILEWLWQEINEENTQLKTYLNS